MFFILTTVILRPESYAKYIDCTDDRSDVFEKLNSITLHFGIIQSNCTSIDSLNLESLKSTSRMTSDIAKNLKYIKSIKNKYEDYVDSCEESNNKGYPEYPIDRKSLFDINYMNQMLSTCNNEVNQRITEIRKKEQTSKDKDMSDKDIEQVFFSFAKKCKEGNEEGCSKMIDVLSLYLDLCDSCAAFDNMLKIAKDAVR